MGSVSIDIHKKERDFSHFTLSDNHVVKYLIEHRCSLDISYGATINTNIYQAGDTFDFNQEIIVLYASLDKTIAECKFKDKSLKLLRLIFEGNTVTDICKSHEEYGRSATYYLLDRIVDKIVKTNHDLWYYTAGHNNLILKK